MPLKKRRLLLGLLVLAAIHSAGCRPFTSAFVTPSATAVPFARDAAIAMARRAARESAPEVGILDARIDSVQAELVANEATAWQALGQDSTVGGDGPVWLVRVHGTFRYQGMVAPPGQPVQIEETDERDFLISARTGEMLGSHHRGQPVATPVATRTSGPTT